MFPHECMLTSVDDKAKCPVDGTTVVNQLVYGRKFGCVSEIPCRGISNAQEISINNTEMNFHDELENTQ